MAKERAAQAEMSSTKKQRVRKPILRIPDGLTGWEAYQSVRTLYGGGTERVLEAYRGISTPVENWNWTQQLCFRAAKCKKA